MFLQSSTPNVAPQPAKKAFSQDTNRQTGNLDYRLRHLEGERFTYILRDAKLVGQVQQFQAAEDRYKFRAPPKGQPHPDYNTKSTFEAAVL